MDVFSNNQYDKLSHCILVYPVNIEKTGDTKTDELNLNIVNKQYNTLLNMLIENDVKPYFLDINGNPSQLFARDIGFVINDLLFISNMKNSLRKSEIAGLKDFVINKNINHYIMQHTVEGGDIIVHNNKVFIGQANRTDEAAFIEIDNILRTKFNNSYECIKVFFDSSKIHLDCVFNIIDKDTCIISKNVYNRSEIIKHFSKAIEIQSDELSLLAPNIVVLGDKILCSSEKLSKVLKNNGYNSKFIQFDEIVKDSGSLGCCVLPLLRK